MKTVLLKQGDITYKIGDGIGAWAKSVECRKVETGEVRVIGGVLMYAYATYDRGWFSHSFEINWTPADREFCHDYANLRKWVSEVS